eukprot:gene8280-105_t
MIGRNLKRKFTTNIKKKIKIGQQDTIKKIFTEEDLITFSKLSYDTNPLHFSDKFAKEQGIFKARIVHGALLGGTKFPGPGSIYMGQTYKFLKPAYLNEEIEAVVTFTKARPEKKIYFFDTICKNSKNEILLTGEAVVYHPDIEIIE